MIHHESLVKKVAVKIQDENDELQIDLEAGKLAEDSVEYKARMDVFDHARFHLNFAIATDDEEESLDHALEAHRVLIGKVGSHEPGGL